MEENKDKIKLSFYLTPAKNPHDGITVMLRNVLNNCNNLEVNGGAYLGINENKENMNVYYKETFPFINSNIKKTIFPKKLLVLENNFRLPLNYSKLLGKNRDAYVFFYNFVPHNNVKGKKILVMHDLTPLKLDCKRKPKILKVIDRYKFYMKRYKYAVSQADLILTLTEFSKKDIIEHFPEAEGKIKIIGCGVDTRKFLERQPEEKIKEVREKYNLPEKYILFVGQARENKNLARLLKSYSQLPNKLKEEYGLVYANTTAELNALAERLDVQEKVRLLNGIDFEDLVAVYQGATVFSLVSLNEGFGIPLIEAMASEVPVLCSNISCLPEVVGEAAITVDPYSEDEITKGLIKILSDEGLRKRLVEQGKERIKIFTWENVAQKFEQYVGELVDKN